MTVRVESPLSCPGVVQRYVHVPGELGRTEWLRVLDPDEWTRDPIEALVFHDERHGQGTGKTGYERAAVVADALKRAHGNELIIPCVRAVQPSVQEPAMPRGFFSEGRREKMEPVTRQQTDWRVGIPNCGTD